MGLNFFIVMIIILFIIIKFDPNFDIVDGWLIMWYGSNYRDYIKLFKVH